MSGLSELHCVAATGQLICEVEGDIYIHICRGDPQLSHYHPFVFLRALATYIVVQLWLQWVLC